MDFKEQSAAGPVLIGGYGGGGFRIADQRFEGAILVFNGAVYPWSVKSEKDITKQSLKDIFSSEIQPEFFIFGVGKGVTNPVPLARKLEGVLGLPVEVMSTGAAARTYNVLTLEGRRVAAGLIAIE